MNRFAFLLLISVSLLTSGCKSVAVDSSFWGNSNKKVLIMLGQLPERGRIYKDGEHELLDRVIDSAGEISLRNHIRRIRPRSFLSVAETFRSRLDSLGYDVSIYPKQLGLTTVSKPSEIRKYLDETGSDYVITLDLGSFGVSRTYYAMVPISDPAPVAMARGQMFSRTEKLWDSGSLSGQVKQTVTGEWKQPPNYPNLTTAVTGSLTKAKQLLVDRFFRGRGEGTSPSSHLQPSGPRAGAAIGSSSSSSPDRP